MGLFPPHKCERGGGPSLFFPPTLVFFPTFGPLGRFGKLFPPFFFIVPCSSPLSERPAPFFRSSREERVSPSRPSGHPALLLRYVRRLPPILTSFPFLSWGRQTRAVQNGTFFFPPPSRRRGQRSRGRGEGIAPFLPKSALFLRKDCSFLVFSFY